MIGHDETLSSRDYTRLCDLIYAKAGIHLGSGKRTMLEVRIKRRLKVLNLSSFGQYCDYLFEPKGLKDELVPLIDVVTTNKTDFFREPRHFNFLVEKALPDLTAANPAGPPLLIWSADNTGHLLRIVVCDSHGIASDRWTMGEDVLRDQRLLEGLWSRWHPGCSWRA